MQGFGKTHAVSLIWCKIYVLGGKKKSLFHQASKIRFSVVMLFFFKLYFLSVPEHLPGFALSPHGVKDPFCFFCAFTWFFFCVWYISSWSPASVSPLSVAGEREFLSFCPWLAFPWSSALTNWSAVPCVWGGSVRGRASQLERQNPLWCAQRQLHPFVVGSRGFCAGREVRRREGLAVSRSETRVCSLTQKHVPRAERFVRRARAHLPSSRTAWDRRGWFQPEQRGCLHSLLTRLSFSLNTAW